MTEQPRTSDAGGAPDTDGHLPPGDGHLPSGDGHLPPGDVTGPVDDDAARGPTQAGVWNIANVLTIFRLALVPVFVAFMFAGPDDVWRIAAFLAYALAAFTDQIDGSVARRRGIVTDFGTFVDPVADKALTGAALVSLSVLGELPWAVTVLVAVREIGVTLLRVWVIRHGVIAASRGGKMKTLFLNVAIGLYVLPLTGLAASARAVVLAAGVTLAVVTGVDYVYRALAVRSKGKGRV